MAFLSEKLISASGGVQEETDDDFNLVTSLYHFDGSNGAQNNTFLDSSSIGHTVTRGGNATQGTFSPFSADEGKWSIDFPGGTGQTNLTISATSDFAFGTGDYTIEAWVFPRSLQNSLTLGNFIIDFRSSGNTGACFVYIGVNGSGDGVLVPVSGNAVAGITLNAWNHIAVSRESSTERTFINGVLKGSNTNSTDFSSNATATIGSRYAINSSNWSPVDGFISNLRVVKGTAVYTSAFTPSTSPLTAVTNTKLLTSCSNRFRDKSTSAHSMTANGTPKIQPFSPFAPSSSYSAASNGGSGYFDGTGDYVSISTSDDFEFGTGDYTIEAWVYKSTTGQEHIYEGRNGGNANRVLFYVNSANKLANYINASVKGAATSDFPLNEWVHVALVRSGTTGYMFQNGTQVSTWTGDSTDIDKPVGNLYIATEKSTNFFWQGYISNLRVVKGTAVYTSAFTPPTAPVTDVTNTKLLVNFTNAAMFDQTGKTNVETVGNAQLDTSVKKFGTASVEFDGTGDYLRLEPTTLQALGSGNFTVEFFLRATNVATTQVFIDFRNNSNTNTALAVYVSSLFKFYAGTSEIIIGAISNNTWHHIAIVRNGSTITSYIDGTAGGTESNTNNLTCEKLTIGANWNTDYPMTGYIDEFRITKSARYTSNFTAPSKEFPNL